MKRLSLVAACLPLIVAVTALPASAKPAAGSVDGLVTAAATGQPVAGACVTVFTLELAEVRSACADAQGRYSIPNISYANYKVRATAAGFSEMWAYNTGSALAADVLDLPHALNFALRQGNATVRGKITDAGAAAKDASVSITDENQRWRSTVKTAADGTYVFTGLTADKYKLNVIYGDRYQWFHQKSSFPDADTFDVANGTTTVVDEAVLDYGAVKFIAVDEVTGAPVRDACAALYAGGPPDRRDCSSGDGIMQFNRLPANGYYTASVWDAAGTHYSVGDLRPSVVAGKTTELRVTLKPAASFRTTVVDARTQAPLPGVCVEPHAVPVEGVVDRDYSWYCTDDSGSLIIGPLDPNTYQFYVKPNDKNYGQQWVGARGGTGDLREAHKGVGKLRETTVLPQIQVDPAGIITGTVTDNTGAKIGACVFPFAVDPRNGFRFLENCTDDKGQYRIRGLGPYTWPLEFLHHTGGLATQWSGGAADRFAATPVTVRAGGTTVADAKLVPSGRIAGRALDRNGRPTFAYVYTFNARTGDIITWDTTDNDNNFEVNSLATQDVKIRYVIKDKTCAYPTPISVTAGQIVKGIDLTEC
ncbi:carboxypeptidase-like regulatory domain-containing protein [Allokutzneria sp. NRRL B-24872]|uniref:carboxypeptidase-like regulatory domain-containing protein n=1 Tax=Allokutzneria sp. NRRL B-24872 TaxID=1137961 RepID=UPI000A383317|nr:carboxypeptidase-like regulatory domain-containing protein [Allokutzneria sp. NRRL B-24872]